MKNKSTLILSVWMAAIVIILTSCEKKEELTMGRGDSSEAIEITNVSYDPTREFYEDYNKLFQEHWGEKNNQRVSVIQSHGGSAKQARSVIEGNDADVVTLALGYDIKAIEKAGMIESGWEKKFRYNSAPYTSTIVFLVRRRNPKEIKDWDDLIRDNVSVIAPNPKTSGGARWNYLAAWAYADKRFGSDEIQIKEYMKQLYENIEVLDSGARGSTTTFVQNEQGDVLLAWENEAYLVMEQHPDQFVIITPSISILAEPMAAVVDEVVKKRGTQEISDAYIDYLYSEAAQKLAAEHYFRPSEPSILKEYTHIFQMEMELVSINDTIFGGWEQVQAKHFQDGGSFDDIYKE
jgi:sulfate/thiosulfate-binding protein